MVKQVENEIVIFVSSDQQVSLTVPIKAETVWLTQEQISKLFGTARSSIAYHIGNIFKEGELDKNSSVEIFDKTKQIASRPPKYYNLDVIISVGYRVKSKRGVEFRQWANSVLKQYILQGYAINQHRLDQLGEMIRVIKRAKDALDTSQVLYLMEEYSLALRLLDDYDHQNLKRPKGIQATYRLTYEECKEVIGKMRFQENSDLFGKEKDQSFQSSIGAIYQSFDGKDVYPSLEEKAAHLLYFITKNHSFIDGNKRIAATIFLYFLNKNGVVFLDEKKLIDDHALAALTIMIAHSLPSEKEIMINLIMHCICAENLFS